MRKILLKILIKIQTLLSVGIKKLEIIGKMEENDTIPKPDKNSLKVHKVVKMDVNVTDDLVTVTTKGDGTTALHSMTLNRAYSKGLLNYGPMNKILV